ncbi:MAG: hypothetical protein Q8Q45_16655 [Methylococcaceae bacterium]|nr:hypothetical protein [Methylococcaceae bacterium]MDP3390119.1 hypothetical protein [Methylococcaceae bacterium]MDP3933970.1 hypothetical protein [Methylococcaceae bacterium]MDZ4155000.1 hypothetical protein [Methylococcales bacterium]
MSSMNNARDLLHSAETCINNDELDLAQSLIDQVVSIRPIEKSIFADAVNILLNAALYSKAKSLFEIYRIETGLNLVSDYSYEEITKMEQDSRPIVSVDNPVRFRRMSIRERGHFSNIFTLWPVKEIKISDANFSITQGGKIYQFDWNQVSSARIVIRDRYKSYGTGTAAKFTQKTFILIVENKEFKFDVSTNFPDFKNNDQLLNLLMKHLQIEIIDNRG